MGSSWQVVVRASSLTFFLLAGCVTITQPQDGAATSRNLAGVSSVTAEVSFRSQLCAGTFNATLDGNNVTAQFSPSGAQLQQATFANLAPGLHTLTASADTLQYWILFPYCGSGTDTANFCVPIQYSIATPSKTAFANRDNLSWLKASDTTVTVAADVGASFNRWNLIRLGGIASSTGLIQSTDNSCLCMRSMDDRQSTPIGLALCNPQDATQQWQALQIPPSGSFRFQNNGRGVSDACLTEGPNLSLIQRSCLDTPDQLWKVRDNTNGQFGSPFF